MTLIASKHADQVLIRLPHGLRERVHACATANGRSMNTEIVHAIERHLADSRSVMERLDRIERQLQCEEPDL